ncbi:MAG TPA: hypothetical protein PK938_01550, partial [Bacteroidaceae bacterium]|nr:hypothetical protein [Bacteroidaceae bacterium]
LGGILDRLSYSTSPVMNTSTIIAIAVIALLVAAALFAIFKRCRKGKSCSGCALRGYCGKE